MKFRYIAYVLLGSFVLIFAWPKTLIQGFSSDNPNQYDIELIGHRGSAGLKPENTWASVKTALRYQMTIIELDLRITKDNEFAVHHNKKLNKHICRRNNKPVKSEAIHKLNSAQLRFVNCGVLNRRKFPSQKKDSETEMLFVSELFRRVTEIENQEFRINLDLKLGGVSKTKTYEAYPKLVQEIKRFGLEDRIIVSSFHYKRLPRLKRLAKKIKINAMLYRLSKKKLRNKMKYFIEKNHGAVYDIISLHHENANSSVIEKAHDHGLKVFIWTVNHENEMKKYLRQGVDGIITDYPNRLFAAWKYYLRH